MLIDVNDDGHVDILQNAAFNFNCLNPGVAPACAGLIGPTVLTGGGSNDWLPGPKVFPNVQYRSTAIDADARVLHDTKVSRVFRTPEQQGTVRDPRLARATSFTYAASDGGRHFRAGHASSSTSFPTTSRRCSRPRRPRAFGSASPRLPPAGW